MDKTLTELCAFDMERFKARRLKAGRKPSTVNRDLSRIRGALSRAVDWAMLPEHPMRTVKPAKGAEDSRARYLSQDEEKRLRAALQERENQRRRSRDSGNAWAQERGRPLRALWPQDGYTDYLAPMVLLAINTGMRRGELLGLRWAEVNLDRKLLTVAAANAKSRRARHIPLNSEAMAVLTRWRVAGARAGDLVFPSPAGGRMGSINSSWEALREVADLADFRFHDLRHTFASHLVMAGVDLSTARELLGHSDIRMTLRYAHLALDKLAEAAAKIG